MNKKSKWQKIKSVCKILSFTLSIIAYILQISGAVDFWSLLVLPLYAFLTLEIPIYYFVLFATGCIVLHYSVKKLRSRHQHSILDLKYARKMALLCQTPRTTEFLREQYDHWESQSNVVVIGGYEFDDYLKRLEKEDFIKYVNGEWQVTPKALEYIRKYYGDSLS